MLEHIVVSPEVTVIRIAIGRKLGYSLEFKKKKFNPFVCEVWAFLGCLQWCV